MERRLAPLVLAAVVALTLPPSPVDAQDREGFRLDRYVAPPTTEDGLALQLPRTLGHLRPSVGLVLDYAHAPLVVAESDGGPSGAIVAHRVVGHIVGALGVTDRIEFHIAVPIVLGQAGDSPTIAGISFPSPDVAGFTDGRIGGSVRIVGEDDDGFQLGLSAELLIPLGVASAYTSDLDVTVRGGALAAYVVRDVITIGLRVGAAYRPERDFETARIGSELDFGLGVYVPVVTGLVLSGELFGATSFRDGQAFQRLGTPLELLFGGRYTLADSGVAIQAGIGFGLTQAPGVPDVRAQLGVGWAPVRETAPIAEEVAPAPPGDRDGDGILDPDDGCPDEAEDADGWQDEDGCPDPDDDGDGIPDGSDGCPREAEDADGFEDENGCPDPDNDGDGILDGSDGCPNEAEDRDGFADSDGCPDPDNDQDTVLDPDDACPTAPGPVEERGCPRSVRIEGDQIRILHRIEFDTGRATIRPESIEVLEDVRAAIAANPEITQVRVEGHTDDRGRDATNLTLSQARADSVVTWLVEHGIERSRLVAEGFGETRPVVPNRTRADRQTNRRVEFHIVQPASGAQQ